MNAQTKEKIEETTMMEARTQPENALPPKEGKDSRPVLFVTLWQDEHGVIQVKLGNGITHINAVALLELGLFRYKMNLLPSISPRPVQVPEGSEPPQRSTQKN